ncbi:hypothetical protein EJP77_16085 [Paenibacillus zeisoli]|uniref:Tetratricopeptide repeat protein n=1 Tax=Paenibacillus zeisoli TaxID=2496267 RepID=A0A3S1DVC3_9BACL|nr:DUF6483 family protein [Paenibacillus zeisoli]RUT28925.1 hypothetical protein EJP77_16085 [Paenibacillus zeisoli]
MLRRDYLIRMIEEMSEVMGTFLGLKQQKKRTEILWQLDEQYKKHFRLNSELLNSLSIRDLIDIFRYGGILEVDKLQSAALLMKEEALVYIDNQEKDKGLIRSIKALHLFLYAALEGADRTLWNLENQVSELESMVKGYRLPSETELLLLRYEEERGRYDLAENALYRMLERSIIQPEEAREFYERLLKLDPEQLASGGLPLSEVEEGLAGLSRI